MQLLKITLLTLVILTPCIQAQEKKLKYEKLLQYEDVTITQITPSKISIIHKNGVSSIPIGELPVEVRDNLGIATDKTKGDHEAINKVKEAKDEKPYKAPDTADDPIEVTRQLYMDLDKFKDDKFFHEVGFAPSQPQSQYRMWYEACDRASKDPRYNKALIIKGIAIGDLFTLGTDYIKSKGKPTEYSKFITKEFLRVLKLEEAKK